MKSLTFCAILTIAVSGCSTVPVDTPIGCPPGPYLAPITQAMWSEIDLETRRVIRDNAIEWEAWRKKACGRIQRHDEALTR